MQFFCEDLSDAGVCLLTPDNADYKELFNEISYRVTHWVPGKPPVLQRDINDIVEQHGSSSAILLNQSRLAIAAVSHCWTLEGSGRTKTVHRAFSPTTVSPLLLPIMLAPHPKAVISFWETIFPGSKRLIKSDGTLLGDNSDVREPRGDELWTGPSIFGRARLHTAEELKPRKLSLDGVFFVDGGFSGPDNLGMWEATIEAAEAHRLLGSIARNARRRKLTVDDFSSEVHTLIWGNSSGIAVRYGPAYQDAARKVLDLCKRAAGNGSVMLEIEDWFSAPMPNFYRI